MHGAPGEGNRYHVPFNPRARPLELDISRPPLPLLPLRPDDSLPILTMALSMDSQSSVSFPLAIQATGLLTFAPVGLTLPLNTPASRDLFGSRRKDHFSWTYGWCVLPKTDAVGSALFDCIHSGNTILSHGFALC